MRLFLDTSSLIKLYHEEKDSDSFKSIIVQNSISSIFLSELTRVEFLSALWKKQRLGELTAEIVRQIAVWFEEDAVQFTFMPLDNHIISYACGLLNKYGPDGLRSLDSIQLATAISLRDKADFFVTSDKLLESLLVKEQLPIAAR
ncbi:Predicted nucleic acid-binding protein, contains PIN domain [Dyadobacter soli]|uniref:Predicted nucleic acid-binding protein, contains PIN domain n=1 Tax=Dyadobacter soli TaxID=659014 RepID=A0A1G7UYH1_9BACT|nr:type II toxin-antitoxin system VapC family toxin [Dyadobacter soli]SDG52645.1 Predicted nucleic acid-binding protein, contains PIN domain [Dyadobacter soli]